MFYQRGRDRYDLVHPITCLVCVLLLLLQLLSILHYLLPLSMSHPASQPASLLLFFNLFLSFPLPLFPAPHSLFPSSTPILSLPPGHRLSLPDVSRVSFASLLGDVMDRLILFLIQYQICCFLLCNAWADLDFLSFYMCVWVCGCTKEEQTAATTLLDIMRLCCVIVSIC